LLLPNTAKTLEKSFIGTPLTISKICSQVNLKAEKMKTDLNIQPTMTKIIPLISVLFFSVFLQAQTNFGGVINDYTPVINIEQCEAIVTVADASAFSPGMSVLLIQMQGALMNETNASTFGDLMDLRSAGLYERNEILSISGNQITMRYSILNPYNLDGAVQLISIPTASEATITSTVTAQPWNGSTGGVVVLDAGSRLTLSADIDVSGQGFRGGQSSTTQEDSCSSAPIGIADRFFYELGNWRGAQKGEGLAAYITGKEAGRGKQINGGGGANDHKTGGGGGSHHSPGGQGGTLESLDACLGISPGGGGILLQEDSTRLFMGGGGGGGHGNEDDAGNGGAGGGIVIIVADEIGGSGTVRVSGTAGEDATEGAGGGGAAGSALLLANTFSGLVLVEANGGKGGDTDSQNTANCSGPGGGGSGGRVYYGDQNSSAPGIAGGQAGIVLNATSICNGSSNGATQGFPGRIYLKKRFPQNLVESPAVEDIIIADCGNPTGSSVQFNIDYPVANYFEYQIGRNDSPFSPQDSTSIDSLIFSNLNPSDSMTILIRAVGLNGCASAFDTISCVVLSCSGIVLAAETNVDTLYCLDDPEVMLSADIEGGIFAIEGVEDSTLSPSDLGVGRFNVTYTYLDSLGCERVDPYPTRIATVAEAPSVDCSSVSDN